MSSSEEAPTKPFVKERQPFIECKFCLKKFIKTGAIDDHECEQMRRFEFSKTRDGFNAYNDYVEWLKCRGRSVSHQNTFLNSRFYVSFVKFQEFVRSHGIPDKHMYIEYMTSMDVSPMFWRYEDFYERFIQWFDLAVPLQKKIDITFSTLNSMIRIIECKPNEVFDYLLPSEVSRLIHERKLCPFVLLLSKKFKDYLSTMDTNQYLMVSSTIEGEHWLRQIKKNTSKVEYVRKILSESQL